ncbi:Mitotic checkpoint protein MAD1, partial [Trachipleistophora hominis]
VPLMNELYEKYVNLLKENNDLKLRIAALEHSLSKIGNTDTAAHEQKENESNAFLVERLEKLEKEKLEWCANSNCTVYRHQEELRQLTDHYKEILKDIRKNVTGLLGYKLDVIDDQVHLHSLYSFDRDDVFTFNVKEDCYEMVNNHFAEGYRKEIDTYVVKGRSVPALLAHVTLDLVSKKTFQ